MAIKRHLVGDTVRMTWISSGTTPSPIFNHLLTGSETSISSTSMTDSGNGHFFRDLTLPDTPGFYVSESVATVDSFEYKRRKRFQIILAEVD